MTSYKSLLGKITQLIGGKDTICDIEDVILEPKLRVSNFKNGDLQYIFQLIIPILFFPCRP